MQSTHIIWLSITEHLQLVHCSLVDETHKKKPITYWEFAVWWWWRECPFVVPSHDLWLLDLGCVPELRLSGWPLMMSFIFHSSHLIHWIANHKSTSCYRDIYISAIYYIHGFVSFLKSTLYFLCKAKKEILF